MCVSCTEGVQQKWKRVLVLLGVCGTIEGNVLPLLLQVTSKIRGKCVPVLLKFNRTNKGNCAKCYNRHHLAALGVIAANLAKHFFVL